MISSFILFTSLVLNPSSLMTRVRTEGPTDAVVLRKSYASLSFFTLGFSNSSSQVAEKRSGNCSNLIIEVPIVRVPAEGSISTNDIATSQCTVKMITSPEQSEPRTVNVSMLLVTLIHPELKQKSLYLSYILVDAETGEFLSSNKNYSTSTHDLSRVDMDVSLDDYPFEGSPKIDSLSFNLLMNDTNASVKDGE